MTNGDSLFSLPKETITQKLKTFVDKIGSGDEIVQLLVLLNQNIIELRTDLAATTESSQIIPFFEYSNYTGGAGGAAVQVVPAKERHDTIIKNLVVSGRWPMQIRLQLNNQSAPGVENIVSDLYVNDLVHVSYDTNLGQNQPLFYRVFEDIDLLDTTSVNAFITVVGYYRKMI